MPHLRRPTLAARHPVQVTMKMVDGLPNLREIRLRRPIREALRAGKARPGFRLVHFSIQHNHLHMLCEAADAGSLARGLQALAIRIAKSLNRWLHRRGAIFRDRYHARILRSPTETRRSLVYVINNVRKHGPAPEWLDSDYIDECSSADYFDGWSRGRPWPRPGEAPVVPPHTFLLAKGWRLAAGGLIAPDEMPARG